MTKAQDEDTILINKALKNNNPTPPRLNFGGIPVAPVAAVQIQIQKQSPTPPEEYIKIGRWQVPWLKKNRWYIPYLMVAAFLAIFGIIATIIYFTVFEARPPSEAAQSAIKKLITLNLENTAGSGEKGSQDGYGGDASFNSPSGIAVDFPMIKTASSCIGPE
jgi:hypothetical protein